MVACSTVATSIIKFCIRILVFILSFRVCFASLILVASSTPQLLRISEGLLYNSVLTTSVGLCLKDLIGYWSRCDSVPCVHYDRVQCTRICSEDGSSCACAGHVSLSLSLSL
jgi:hypothetical protein